VKPPVFYLSTAAALFALIALIVVFSAILPPAGATNPALSPTGANRAAEAVAIVPKGMPNLPTVTVTSSPTAPPTATRPPTATPSPTATATPAPPTPTTQPFGPGGLPFPLKTDRLEFGVAAHLFYTDRDTPLTMARDAGLGWVRQQIHWSDQEGPAGNYAWGELDGIVDSVNAYGLKLLISITSAPSFYTANGNNGLPQDPQALGNFVAALADHYRGRVQAIEIWNEQNLAVENGGWVTEADAGYYVELLKVAYTRIKEIDPSIYVVAGPPASTAVNSPGIALSDEAYFRAMYAYQEGIIRNYFDIQAVHPGGSANPPDTLWPDNPSHADGWTTDRTFYFRRVEDIRKLMEEYGMADHQIWITEYGWATQNGTPGFEFGNQVSYEQQADYIVGAMRLTKEKYPWVGNMILWNLNFGPLKAQDGDPLNEQASFSILNGDYSPRPAYLAIQSYIGELRAQGQ
jgi:polysaccharide biosynthesis protein PslG